MDSPSLIIVWIAFTIICYVMAENRGRNKLLGIAGGLLFGIFAIIYYWIVGDTPQKRLDKIAIAYQNLKKE